MSKYKNQDVIEEDGNSLFHGALDHNYFLINDFSATSGKDRCPDIDGQIRLRDGNGNYLNRYLHYQLKSTARLKNNRFHCEGPIIDYLTETNVPALLFVADIKNKKVFWFYLDENQKKKLAITTGNNSDKTIDLSQNEIIKREAQELCQKWLEFAKPDDFPTLNDAIKLIETDFGNQIRKCLGLIYLLQRVPKAEIVALFHHILKLDPPEIESILKKLIEKDVLNSTLNYYLLGNEQLGLESLYGILSDLDFTLIEEITNEKEETVIFFKQLSKINHEIVQKYLLSKALVLSELTLKSKSNEELFKMIGLLKVYAFRVPKETCDIIRTMINSAPLPPIVTEYEGFGPVTGKSHSDLIMVCLEILDGIRYFDTRVLELLIVASNFEEVEIKEKVAEVLKNLCKYNLYVLQQIGYAAQKSVLDIIEKNIKDLFIAATTALSNNKKYSWMDRIWYRKESILEEFKEEDFNVMLYNLLCLPVIEYHAEGILSPIAEKYPEKIIEFFYDRVTIEAKTKSNIEANYAAIPFRFHNLNTVLQSKAEKIIPLILDWYSKKHPKREWLFRWNASKLLHIIFPSFNPILERTIIEILRDKQSNSIKIILDILDKYEGEPFLWSIIKTTIEEYSQTGIITKIKKDIFLYLSKTGVVVGFDGFSRAFEDKKQWILQHENDSSPAVKEFINEYKKHLDQSIEYERKRAHEKVELMKRSLVDH